MSDYSDLPLFNQEGKLPELFKEGGCYCPICDKYFPISLYLANQIKDKQVLWFANMVMHYRHTHIAYWNRCWGRGGVQYRRGWFENYKQEKIKVNEKVKRQILRKCFKFMLAHKMGMSTIKGIIYNSEYTLQVAEMILVRLQTDNKDEI